MQVLFLSDSKEGSGSWTDSVPLQSQRKEKLRVQQGSLLRLWACCVAAKLTRELASPENPRLNYGTGLPDNTA